MRRPAGRWNFTVNGKPAAVDVPPPTAGAKPVSRSSHAKGLRRRACAYLQRSCHANPIRWLADGFPGSNPHAQPGSRSLWAASLALSDSDQQPRQIGGMSVGGASYSSGVVRLSRPLPDVRAARRAPGILLLISVAGCRSCAQRDLGRPQKVPTAILMMGGHKGTSGIMTPLERAECKRKIGLVISA